VLATLVLNEYERQRRTKSFKRTLEKRTLAIWFKTNLATTRCVAKTFHPKYCTNRPVGLDIFGRSNPIGCPIQYTVLSRSLNTLYFIVLSIQLGYIFRDVKSDPQNDDLIFLEKTI
jgi:hypothetical protein